MELIRTIIKQDNQARKEEERIYRSKDNLGLKNYLEIKNKFFHNRLDMVVVDEINELGFASYITLHYKIVFYDKNEDYPFYEVKEDLPLFTNTVKINNKEEEDYNFNEPINEENGQTRESMINHFINFYNNHFLLEFVLNIVYYKTSPLDDYQIEDDEDDEEDDEDDEEESEIPPVALSYPFKSCAICYAEKPNILNYPCLHVSQCKTCDEKGKFINCIICKEEIMYKIKI